MQRFTALFFDDYHIVFGNLVQVREAARRYLHKKLEAGASVGVFTASGRPRLEFTSDLEAIDQALAQLNFNRRFEGTECPNLPPYFAELVANDIPMDDSPTRSSPRSGQPPLEAIAEDKPLKIAEAVAAQQHCPVSPKFPDKDMRNRAMNMVMVNKLGVQETFLALGDLVQRMAATASSQGTIAMVSDGFFQRTLQYRIDDLIDRALRANVVVNALDARGLFAEYPGADPTEVALSPDLQNKIKQLKHLNMQIDADPLNEVALSTGGVFIQNTNDMLTGIARISGFNAAAYVLGFSPQNLKSDGRFHVLRVKLNAPSRFTLQARRGYFAPQNPHARLQSQRERLEEAAFSHQNLSGFPLEVSVRATKMDETTDRVAVDVGVDMQGAHFAKRDGRNVDDVAVLVAVFDKDGNYVTADQQTVKMRLPDDTLAALRKSGGEAEIQLSLKPGSYVVRTVVSDTASQKLGAISRVVEIPLIESSTGG